jgi:excisionase family DNA binding protein
MEPAMKKANGPTVFTVCEVARILRIGKISVYQAIARGEIPCIRIGRRILIPKNALEQMLSNLIPITKPAA